MAVNYRPQCRHAGGICNPFENVSSVTASHGATDKTAGWGALKRDWLERCLRGHLVTTYGSSSGSAQQPGTPNVKNDGNKGREGQKELSRIPEL